MDPFRLQFSVITSLSVIVCVVMIVFGSSQVSAYEQEMGTSHCLRSAQGGTCGDGINEKIVLSSTEFSSDRLAKKRIAHREHHSQATQKKALANTKDTYPRCNVSFSSALTSFQVRTNSRPSLSSSPLEQDTLSLHPLPSTPLIAFPHPGQTTPVFNPI